MAIHGTRIAHVPIVVAVITVTMLGAACGPGRGTLPGVIGVPQDQSLRVRVSGRVVSVPLDRYVLGAALSEITPTRETQATTARVYDVQAVIARTYALAHRDRHATEGFDLCDTTHCQVYQPD